MSKPVKYFAIIGVLIAGGLLAYNFFFKGQGFSTASLLVSERADIAGASADVTGLLAVLKSLQGLTLDTSVFEDAAFRSLKDYSVILEVVPQGKANPFAPL
ncbi:MAG: hypothetical protein HYT29_02505 [Parcubacteria group bacterium]|nr:hypothetical protein [Parcubacteria group bacterium]